MEKNRKKVSFYTLGCKLNFAETSTIARSFPEDQFEIVRQGVKADIYVINTCSVTEVADRKCRQAIKKFNHQSPDALIAVVGCYAQLNPEKISSIPGVDIVLGTNEKFNLTSFLKNTEKKALPEVHSCDLSGQDRFFPSYSVSDRTRSFLKVQDGCDYKCSYCTIPLARGNSRNQDIASIVREVELIALDGKKEIVLTGVNIGDFGKTTGESLYDLMIELTQVEGIERYRISSIEPNLITDEIIELAAASSKILPHFHIPLQSGSDKILGLMRRRYRREQFENRLLLIRKLIPLASIGADVIVGFPGETDEDFEDTYSFLESMPLSYLHVFNFSERPGTPAQKLPEKIPFKTREDRSRKLIELSNLKHSGFCRTNIGTTAEVLFEHTISKGMISGFTGNYLRTELPWDPELPGTIRKVLLTGVSDSGRMTSELNYSI
jgi:threonylcarbamoyladenosine tRNA methylthiotransferase MtaB